MMVASRRQPAFASACPRVGSARSRTVRAAEKGASSWSQKLVSNDIVTAIQRRTAKAQELMGSPASRNANGVAAGTADVAPRAGETSVRAAVIAMSISNFCRWICRTASASHYPGRPIGDEQCSGVLVQRGAVLVAIWFGPTGDGDRGNEAVAAPGDVYDESVAIAPITQRATQGGHMNRKVGRLDKYVGPNPSHQFL